MAIPTITASVAQFGATSHDDAHCAFMTLLQYTRTIEEGRVPLLHFLYPHTAARIGSERDYKPDK
jgi:hypothetical protein